MTPLSRRPDCPMVIDKSLRGGLRLETELTGKKLEYVALRHSLLHTGIGGADVHPL